MTGRIGTPDHDHSGDGKGGGSISPSEATIAGLEAPRGSNQRNLGITGRKAPRKPLLVMEYDDGTAPTTDFFDLVHEPEGVPAVVGQVPNEIGDDGMLSQTDLAPMENDGWEIACHGRRRLGNYALTEDAAAGDTKIYVQSNVHGNRVADEIVISDDTGTEELAALDGNGDDATGDYLILEAGLNNSYTVVDNAQERLADWVQHRQLGGGLRKLQAKGFTVSSHIYVGGKHDAVTRGIAAQYFDQVGIGESGWNTPPLDPMQLSRRNMETDQMTDADIETYLDEIKSRNVLGILGGHPRYDTMTTDRAQFVVDQAQSRGIEIVTLREALMHYEVYNYRSRVDLLEQGGVHFDGPGSIRETGNGNMRIDLSGYLEIQSGSTRVANVNPYDDWWDFRTAHRQTPKDVRTESGPLEGLKHYHDGSGANTAGPAYYDGAAWISLVDGTTIS